MPTHWAAHTHTHTPTLPPTHSEGSHLVCVHWLDEHCLSTLSTEGAEMRIAAAGKRGEKGESDEVTTKQSKERKNGEENGNIKMTVRRLKEKEEEGRF